MKISVWDTYVTKADGNIMHFDILVPSELKDAAAVIQYGREYLKKKGQGDQRLSTNECRYCHSENASPSIEQTIQQHGYAILEMEGC